MAKKERFRWIEGGANYQFVYDDTSILVMEVDTITFPTRLSREELDGLMHRYLENCEHFVDNSAEIFLEYLTKRGIELPR